MPFFFELFRIKNLFLQSNQIFMLKTAILYKKNLQIK